ncbi:MAG: biotin--[acetyl-CoA-carboxylase] ligase [Candidatus Bathyarchaeia archaeon]
MVPLRSGISLSKIKEELQTDFVGRETHHFAEITSTNDVAKELAAKGAKEGTLVISETQTLGRGRLGREWASPEGGLWFSIILRPKVDPRDAPKLTFTAAVAVARAIREMFNLEAEIKWPNDVLICGKKVCGILTETSIKGEIVDFVVVGVGINANASLDSFPENLRDTITSLKEEIKEEIEREEFLCALLEKLEHYYKLFLQKEFDLILEEWRRLARFLGQYVEVASFDERIKGLAVDVDQDGALVIKLRNGTAKRVKEGDLRIQKPPFRREDI